MPIHTAQKAEEILVGKKELIGISIIFALSTLLFSFTFWLGFPGFFQLGDIYGTLAVETDHWHPVFIARFIESLYRLFGNHSYYLFLVNIFCFYFGLFFYTTALYIRLKSLIVLAVFAITLIGNIFFQNFIQYHSFTFPMLLWLGLSIIFFQILVRLECFWLRWFLHLLATAILAAALLWRHNAIISIYPLFVFFIYALLDRANFNNKIRYFSAYASLLILIALILILIVKGHPYLLSPKITKLTTNHIFLHQIAGVVVPADDPSFFLPEWYEKNKSFQDVKELYKQYPLNADPLAVRWEPWGKNRPFKIDTLDGLKGSWLKAIVTYPGNYANHITRYFRAMWFQEPGWILDSHAIQQAPSHPWHIRIASRFSENERQITFSPLQKKIYDYLYNNKLLVNHSFGVYAGFFLLVITSLLWIYCKKLRSNLLLFSFATSLSSSCSALIICLFSPAPDPRYMSPVLVLSLISLLSSGAFAFLLLARQTVHAKVLFLSQ